jgi:hypothetical protein
MNNIITTAHPQFGIFSKKLVEEYLSSKNVNNAINPAAINELNTGSFQIFLNHFINISI